LIQEDHDRTGDEECRHEAEQDVFARVLGEHQDRFAQRRRYAVGGERNEVRAEEDPGEHDERPVLPLGPEPVQDRRDHRSGAVGDRGFGHESSRCPA